MVRTRNGVRELYVVHRPRYNDWSFPKGHIDLGESVEQAALREVQEETGMVCRVVRPLPLHSYTLPDGTEAQVYFFEMEVVDESAPRVPTDDEVDIGEWCTVDEALERVSYSAVKEYLAENYSS